MRLKLKLKTLDIYLVILIIILTIISFLPAKYLIAVYTPSIIGYVWLFSIPVIIILMIVTTIIDYKKMRTFPWIRVTLFLLFVIFSILIWYFRSYLNNN